MKTSKINEINNYVDKTGSLASAPIFDIKRIQDTIDSITFPVLDDRILRRMGAIGIGGSRFTIPTSNPMIVAKIKRNPKSKLDALEEARIWLGLDNRDEWIWIKRHLAPYIGWKKFKSKDVNHNVIFMQRVDTFDSTIIENARIYGFIADDEASQRDILKAVQLHRDLFPAGLTENDFFVKVSRFMVAMRILHKNAMPFILNKRKTCTPDMKFSNLGIHEGEIVLLDYQCIETATT